MRLFADSRARAGRSPTRDSATISRSARRRLLPCDPDLPGSADHACWAPTGSGSARWPKSAAQARARRRRAPAVRGLPRRHDRSSVRGSPLARVRAATRTASWGRSATWLARTRSLSVLGWPAALLLPLVPAVHALRLFGRMRSDTDRSWMVFLAGLVVLLPIAVRTRRRAAARAR